MLRGGGRESLRSMVQSNIRLLRSSYVISETESLEFQGNTSVLFVHFGFVLTIFDTFSYYVCARVFRSLPSPLTSNPLSLSESPSSSQGFQSFLDAVSVSSEESATMYGDDTRSRCPVSRSSTFEDPGLSWHVYVRSMFCEVLRSLP